MQIFAVILAAIAALAATGQAYLLWRDRPDPIHEKRVGICEGALAVLDSAVHRLASIEQDIEEMKADGLSDAERLQLTRGGYNAGTYFVTIQTGYAPVYLTESEMSALGLREIEGLPDLFDYDERASDEDIKAIVDAYRAAAAKLESAKAVCAPIMLGKVK